MRVRACVRVRALVYARVRTGVYVLVGFSVCLCARVGLGACVRALPSAGLSYYQPHQPHARAHSHEQTHRHTRKPNKVCVRACVRAAACATAL